MWSKERWESRWRIGILNPIGWILAGSFPFLYHFLAKAPAKTIPAPFTALLHYPYFAFGWFGEDLPELLFVYALTVAVGTITREWQSGSIEFLAQLPLTPRQIALRKGVWGSLEIGFVSVISTAVLWLVSALDGHSLPRMPLILSTLLIACGFIGVMWLLSACAWAIHSTYAIILIGIGFYIASVVVRGISGLRAFSPLAYICDTSPDAHQIVLWEHLAIVLAVVAGLIFLTAWIAGRQELIANHGRDQM